MFQAANDVCFCLVFFDFRHFLKIVDYCINQNKYTPKIKLLYICKFLGKENAKYFQNFYLCKMLILCKLKNILKKGAKIFVKN